MPNHLEFVVRPTQLTPIRPGVPTQLLATPKIIDNPGVTWGRSGATLFDFSAQDQSTVKPANFNETQRTTDTVRVHNPDDTSQFIDTEQMTAYQGRDPKTGAKISLKFQGNTNTDNTEVIQKGVIKNAPGT
jgi:hypothetical protein